MQLHGASVFVHRICLLCGCCRRESSHTQTLLNGFSLEVIREITHKGMIHINVADTQTLVEKSDGVTKYTAYNIYVNGSFHAAVRFSRLIQFAEAIKQRFATKNHLMLRFPSKQWFPLDEKGIEQRRIKISNYFNLLAQSPDIVRSLFVERRFLEFQIESYPETSSNISLNVFLGDGYKISMTCALSLCTDDVMKKIAKQLQTDNSERFVQMFGLFLARPRNDSSNHVDGQFNMLVVRLLRNFESPYATLQTANRQSAVHGVCYKLVIRKMIWDPRVEQTLLGDAVFVDLLYRQAKSDLKNGFFSTSSESIAEDLRILEADDDKLQYLRICHQFPSYSYEIFPHCISDYPEPDTPCEVMIGRRQLVLVSSGKEPKQHYAFRATRIHLWKICDSTNFAGQGPLIFQFEYLVDKSSFKWITLCTDHAILISMLIHSIGAEILRERSVLKGGGGHALQVKSCSGHSKGLVTGANRSDSNSATVEAEIHHSKASTYEASSTWKVVNQKSLIRVVRTGIVAFVSNDRLNTSGGSNPLGICQHSDLFTTITVLWSSFYVMEYFNKFRATVTQVAAQVTNALPGNPLLREYEIGGQICTAGPGFYWKVFKGVKKSTKKVVSIWLFDKKDTDRWPKDDRELFLSLIKHGVSQLTRLRHPRLLVVEHPIEESRDSLAFATEPVFACLANCLSRCKHLSLPISAPPSDITFSDIEIKHGLLQLGEALSFLHIDAGILHRNVTPESVVVSDRGAWKLAGFEFSVQGRAVSPGKFIYEMFNWSSHVPAILQPNLDYLAPEYVVGSGCDSSSDIYSLGVLSFVVYNECRPPFEHKNDLAIFKKNVEKLDAFQVRTECIPPILLKDLKVCLKCLPNLRPDAIQFTKIAYFNDPLVKTLNLFESLIQLENSRKIHFFKSLPGVLVRFEKRVLLQKVLPYLSCEFSTPDLIPFILPSIFLIIEQVTKQEFSTEILPTIMPLFSMGRPYQIALLLLQKMELLLEKASEEHVKCYVLPLVYNALSSETMRIRELCISIVPNISKLVDRSSMKTELLPKLLKLATDGSMLAIRVQALLCIGKLLPTLESWMVTDLILPALPKVKSREPAVLMAILGIYKLTADCESVVVSREQWAKSALPFLIPICVENTLNLGQFEQFIAFIKSVIGIVERDQRLRLQQLSAMQEQQIDAANLDEVMKPDSTVTNADLASLKDIHGIDNIVSCVPVNLEKKLPLSEERISASKQERNHGLQSQASMQPVLSPVECYSKLPTMALKPNDGFTLVGESTVQPFHQELDMYICPQRSGVVPALNNLDLSVFESGGSTWAEFSAVDERLRYNSASEGCFPTGFPEPPKSTNAAIQRTNKSTRPLTSLDSLLSFSSNNHEIARIEENNKSLKSTVHQGGSKALDPFVDFFM